MERGFIKIVMAVVIGALLSSLVPSVTATAKGPTPFYYNRPVRLDPSGRPLYNSWERRDVERRRPSRPPSPRPRAEAASPTPSERAPLPSRAVRAAGQSAIQPSTGGEAPALSPVPLEP